MEPIELDKAEWDLPHEFEEPNLPEWPKNIFDEQTQRYVDELTRSTETPPELASMLCLATIATAAQKKYIVEVKKGYCEPVNIYTLPILPPASRKSAVFTEITSPIRAWEDAQKARLEPLVNADICKHKTIEQQLKQFRRELSVSTKIPTETELQKLLTLENELRNKTTYPQLWTSDITPEHLGTLMAANEGAMAILSDEGGIFDILRGLYTNGNANIDLLLQSHSASSCRIDRRTKEPIFLERAVLTIALTVQPHVIQKACSNSTFRGRGLLGRFLYVFPESNIGYRTLEEQPMDDALKNHFNATIEAILNHPLPASGTQKMHVLQLDPDAYAMWLDFARTIEKLMHPDIGLLSDITDWAGKLSGQIARMAGSLHINRYAFDRPWEKKISLQTMENAIRVGHALIAHALKTFSFIDEERPLSIAKVILQWILDTNSICFSRREFQRKNRKYHKTNLLPAFDLLKARGFIHEEQCQGPLKGAPSTIYYVNPHLKAIYKGQKGQ
ncbi:MAG: DUF3987 domain-containing protein [Chlamydiales bacterium]|nr:DUF3987 domain-containing protein [Chlamydiales bacterium]